VVVVKKWNNVLYDTNSDTGEVRLESRVRLLENYITVTKEGRPKIPFEIVVRATKSYTKVEYTGKDYSLEFDSEGKDGSAARLQMSCKVGADGLLRYNVRISDDDVNYHYRIIPQKTSRKSNN